MQTAIFAVLLHFITPNGQHIDNMTPMGSEIECVMNAQWQNASIAKDPSRKGWHAECVSRTSTWRPVR